MKKLLLSLLGTCLISNVLAQHPSQPAQDHKRLLMAGKVVNVPANEDTLLFYKLPRSFAAEGNSKLSFLLHDNGTLLMAEQIIIDPDDRTTHSSVQFLSGEPERLNQLLEMSSRPEHNLGLMIRANGQVLREFAFKDFLAYARRLKQQPGLHPAHTTSLVTLFNWPGQKAKGSSGFQPQDLTCTQECDLQYQACAEEACGDPNSICGPCYDSWVSCRDSCPQDCYPSSYVTGSETYTVSCSVIGDAGCYWSSFFQSYTVQYYGYCLLVTYTHIHHVNCDGPDTDTTETSYSSGSGWVDTGESCY